MGGYLIEDYVLDIGTLPNYQQAQITWPGNDGVSDWSAPNDRPAAGAPQPARRGLQTHWLLPGEIQ